MKIIIFLISFIIVSGCAQEMSWSHSYKNTQDFYADRAKCSSMAGNGQQNQIYIPQQQADGFASGLENGWNLGGAMGTSNARSQIFNDCMMGNGWFLVTSGQQATSQSDQVNAHAQPTSTENNTPQGENDGEASSVVMVEIHKIPELEYWMKHDKEKFDYAVSVDEELKLDSNWKDRPLSDRFQEATKRTMKHFNM